MIGEQRGIDLDICMYFQVHQPMRLRKFSLFNESAGSLFDLYFDHELNERILRKVATKCYFPTNSLLLELLDEYPDFRVGFSLTGVFMEQCKRFMPEVLDSFKALADTGRVDFLAETYYHSLSSLFPKKDEFFEQLAMHKAALAGIHANPQVFRNTEAMFSNEIAWLAEGKGYKGIMTEGLESFLGWRSPNYVYSVKGCKSIRALLRNYKLSDDVGYRFSARWWSEYPLTADKYAAWLATSPGEVINIFMDYETFGEHQWADTGIFQFMRSLPGEVLNYPHLHFKTPAEVAASVPAKGEIDVPNVISWADMERDTSAWLGNEMQRACFTMLQELEQPLKELNDPELLHIWRLLQNSDHLYYLSTKSLSDQDVHNYFSPYDNPFEGFINFMNILQDFKGRVEATRK